MVHRSRLYVVLGVLGCALAIIFHDSYVPGAILLAAAGAAITNAFLRAARLAEIRRRPAAFTVADGKFIARLLNSQGLFVMVYLPLLGLGVGDMLRNFEHLDRGTSVLAWIELGMAAFVSLMVILLVAAAWSTDSGGIELTPEGIVTRSLWDRRTIPWDALAHGGPLRPARNDTVIRLVFARPELIRRSRLRLPGWGRERITTQMDVHPSLIADAIRWYTENPADRAAIGTQAEHDRLVAAVGAFAYQEARPAEQPPIVRTAIRLGYAGVAFGLSTAILDVALVFGLEDRLEAHAVAVGEQEVREFGAEPVDWESSVYFGQAWYVGVLGCTALAALVALLAIHALKRGNDTGRIGLIAVSALAALWALMPSYELALDPPPGLGSLFLAVTVVKRLGYLGLGIATLVPLVTPSAQAFTQPRPA